MRQEFCSSGTRQISMENPIKAVRLIPTNEPEGDCWEKLRHCAAQERLKSVLAAIIPSSVAFDLY
jgi:hypothetical protein